MIIDFRDSTSPSKFSFDVCIIGAGPAGMTIAEELSKASGRHIGVIESGGLAPEAATQSLYEIRTDSHPYFDPDGNRLRYLGGSANHWGQQVIPIENFIFRSRPWVQLDGWPIAAESLSAYYRRAHELLKVGKYKGPSHYDPKIVFSDNRQWGLFRTQYLKNRLKRIAPIDLPNKYRALAKKKDNISVLIHANVIDIHTSAMANNVSNIKIQDLGSMRKGVITSKVFVLACGGIENPRILLNANSIKTVGLGNDHDLVGRYFMEHPHVYNALKLYSTSRIFDSYDYFEKGKERFIGNIVLSKSFQRRKEVLTASLSCSRNPETLQVGERSWFLYNCGIQSEQAPNRESRVRLNKDRDALAQRRVTLSWNLLPIDLKTIREATLLFAQEVGRLGLGRIRLDSIFANGDWSLENIKGGAHHMGTTRMARLPTDGVVNTDCRVFGIRNLFIAGSSVFPSVGYSNPTMTIISLALRLADHLKLIL